MEFGVRILGCKSAMPGADEFASSQIVLYNNKPYLIDCAEGTQMQMRKYKISFGKLKEIFISHLHGDHFFGIFGLISSLSMLGRKQKLYIYGPPGLDKIINDLFSQINYLPQFELIFIDLNKKAKNIILKDKNLSIYSFPLKHSIDSWGFVFEENQKPANIRKDIVSEFNLNFEQIKEIKNGADFTDKDGHFYRNYELVCLSEIPRTYVYCGDTMFSENMIKFFTNPDLLYHEATFSESDKKLAKQTYHSTAIQAAQIAAKVKAGKLIIGHFSTRYKNTDILLDEAVKVFKNTLKAEDGMYICIPNKKKLE